MVLNHCLFKVGHIYQHIRALSQHSNVPCSSSENLDDIGQKKNLGVRINQIKDGEIADSFQLRLILKRGTYQRFQVASMPSICQVCNNVLLCPHCSITSHSQDDFSSHGLLS